MSVSIDLHDLQGNVAKGYAKFGFPVARYLFLEVTDERQARAWLGAIWRKITTAAPWHEQGDDIPAVTTNIAFTYNGLKALGLPRESLQTFPEEFVMGMRDRNAILGDDGPSAPECWDPIWQNPERIHIWMSINGRTKDDVHQRWQELDTLRQGVELLSGHRGDEPKWQDASILFEHGKPTPKEHFGYVDGISNPYFEGSGSHPDNVIGGGKPTGKDPSSAVGWEAIAAGEFVLGHRDESAELPKAPLPRLLSQNGSFMVYRKLHQNIGSFNRYLEQEGQHFPGGAEKLAAKFAGRWRSGEPITTHPDKPQGESLVDRIGELKAKIHDARGAERDGYKKELGKLKRELTGFNFRDDIAGSRCPAGAHIRRNNPRGALEFGQDGSFKTPGALDNRRRIMRRGMPYGQGRPNSDDGEHGIVFMTIGASIKRQFEFVQQQWVNYGNDFKLSNDRDPLLGNHEVDSDGKADGQFVIEGDEKQAPWFCSGIPRFVETRGGEYFFVPSLTALHMIAEGIIDPT